MDIGDQPADPPTQTSAGAERVDARFIEVDEPDGRTRWRLDAGFLTSNWTCIWGRGCQGIHDERRPELMDGCCSVGVILRDADEAMNVVALAATLSDEQFQFASVDGGYVDQAHGRLHTRVVDGACVFLNRHDFAGGAGCALHRGAIDSGEDPVDWKPQTCSRVPLRVEESTAGDTTYVTLRAWNRSDWGPGGNSMAWWCTEGMDAFVGERTVLESEESTLRVLFGDALYDDIRRRLG
jgi:hypothetical protein